MPGIRTQTALCFALLGILLAGSSARALDLQLLNGWNDAPSGTSAAEVVSQDGVIRFKGAIAGGSGGVAFNLPPALRPLTDVYVAVALCNANQGRLYIQPTGDVTVQAPLGAFADAQCLTSLDGASFAQSPVGPETLVLANGWTHAPYSTSNAAALLIGDTVHLKGAVATGTAARITTLPVSLRPASQVYVPVGLCNSAKGRLRIAPTGEVDVQPLSSFADATCFTSLDGAKFVRSASGFSTLSLTNGWSHAPFGTRTTAAALIDGVVTFQGAIAGGSSGLAFTLPVDLRPMQFVYVPVDLCDANKGRLSIAPTGAVTVESASGFASASCFTSLEGASFIPSVIGLAGWPLPASFPAVVLSNTSPVTFKIDLSTLPIRPALIIDVVPDAAHPTMQLEIEATNWSLDGGYVFGCASSIFSTSGPGLARLAIQNLYACPSGPFAWTGGTADIKIHAVHFGSGSPPATVSVQIRGETRPPTGTATRNVDEPFVSRTVAFEASKDAVLYQDVPDYSNGRGEYLWAGQETISAFQSDARNAIIGFDLESEIASTSVVQAASLSFEVTGLVPSFSAQRLVIQRVAPDAFGDDWEEGFQNAAGTEFDGAPGSVSGADWLYRSRLSVPWATAGGDVTGPTVLDTTIGSTGVQSFAPPALVTAVQALVSTGRGRDGFMLRNPAHLFAFAQEGIQIASRDHPTAVQPPTLTVQYYPTEVVESGEISTGTISYIDAAQNFRWIYDLDQDGIYVTPIAGVCEATNPSSPNPNLIPYTYRYQGTPGYTGVDCCTWRISSGLGIVGTGQALFFHNLDANNPANLPPDSDRDGIRDLCDNCPYYANGPLLGACLAGSVGAPCRSNQACGAGGVCSLSQEYTNGSSIGDVCAPEPGFAAGLGCALMTLAALSRGRTRARDPRGDGVYDASRAAERACSGARPGLLPPV